MAALPPRMSETIRDTILFKHVASVIAEHRLIKDDERVVVGVSGGPDSVCLLVILAELIGAPRIETVYVDHGLRPAEVPAETALVRRLCETLGCRLTIRAVDVERERGKSGESVEQCGRRLRYDAFMELRRERGCAVIAVGHTRDDQAEEFLLRLIRGTGMAGLAGMAMRGGVVIRPLLRIDKSSILTFLQEQEIPYCFDGSNNSTAFFRNRVRLELLPFIRHRFNPDITSSLVQTADILREDDTLLAELSTECFAKHAELLENGTEINIYRHGLAKEPLSLQRRVIAACFHHFDHTPTFAHIDEIRARLVKNGTSGELHLPGRLRALFWKEYLSFIQLPATANPRGSAFNGLGESIICHGAGDFACPAINRRLRIAVGKGMGFDPRDNWLFTTRKIVFPVTIRDPLPGETMVPVGSRAPKKITRLRGGLNIAPHQRARYPVLVAGDAIVCLLGVCGSADYATDRSDEECMTLAWQAIS